MKKILISLLTVLCLFGMVACSSQSPTEKTTVENEQPACVEEQVYHTVTFYLLKKGGSILGMGSLPDSYVKKAEIKVADGDVIGNQAPNQDPDIGDVGVGYIWYINKAYSIEWNIYSDEVKTDMFLYGKTISV